MIKQILFLLVALAAVHASAGIMEDFDSLGGNNVLLDRAKALNPETSVGVVQDRIVNRHFRWELSPEATSILGGDSYLKSSSLGMNMMFHINPHWSIGAKYTNYYNKLSTDGENLIKDTSSTGVALVPAIDYPMTETMAMLDWYPFYGKLSLFEKSVAHFDIYPLVGLGNIELKSGKTSTWTAGGGIGFWISQHLTARMEMRYQTYKAKGLSGDMRNGFNTGELSDGLSVLEEFL